MVKPQLPASAVVTPCSGDGVSAPSQNTWASKCVCTSTNPGVTTLPVASIVVAASVVDGADPHDAVAVDADVGAAPRRAGAVDEVTTRDHDVEHGVPLLSTTVGDRRRLVRGYSERLELGRLDAEVALEVAVHVEDPALLARQREVREAGLVQAALRGAQHRDVLVEHQPSVAPSGRHDVERPGARRAGIRRRVGTT